MTDAKDHIIYAVEAALKRMNKSRVTSTRNSDYVLFVMDFRWEFKVDEDELDRLYDAVESAHAFKDVFNNMAEKSLRLNVMR